MSNKVKLIKEEIERQIEEGKVKCQQSKENNSYESFVAWSEHVATCGKLLVFINSLPEESASEYLEEEIESYIKDSLAIKFPTTDKEQIKADIRYIARHFAEWQRKKDFEDFFKSDMTMPNKFYEKGKADALKEMEEALQTEYEKGRFDMREEMMKDVVEGIVGGHTDIPAFINLEIEHKPNVKVGDKVKIVILKTE